MDRSDWAFLFLILGIVSAIIGGAIGLAILLGPKKVRVCGKIVDKFTTSAAYKVSAEPHVILYSDSLRRKVDIRVTWNTHANMTIGNNACFTIRENRLDW